VTTASGERFEQERPQPEPLWFESAAKLLTEPDPGPTPFLVDELIVDGSIAAVVGSPKNGKTWTLLDLAIAVATGELALSRFTVENSGPVLLVLEESGREALHRRLDKLVRGRALDPERLATFYFAANKRVRLDDDGWRTRLRDAASAHPWRLIAFDPPARIKGLVDENVQREIGPVLDFLRELREISCATVVYVHHTPHDGTRQRGSSDLEAYWESKLTLAKKDGKRTLKAEHREAEDTGPYLLSFGFDSNTETLRFRAYKGELEQQVREYLDEHPSASANDVDDAIPGNRKRVLELVPEYRGGGSDSLEPPGTTPAGSALVGGSSRGAYKAPGTTPTDLGTEVVPDRRNHPRITDVGEKEIDRLAAAAREAQHHADDAAGRREQP
jgi:AAA domain